ncbi:D-lactate ferricytochrome c oxidoreductase [Clarireedia jacksonii]
MFSARYPPIAGVRLATFCRPRRGLGKLHANHISSPRSRWQSTHSASAERPAQVPHGHGFKPTQSGWGTGRVLLLTAASGGLAYAVATLKEKNRQANRDYSDPSKFVQPKYASVKDMELALQEIRQATDEDTISTDAEDLLAHG